MHSGEASSNLQFQLSSPQATEHHISPLALTMEEERGEGSSNPTPPELTMEHPVSPLAPAMEEEKGEVSPSISPPSAQAVDRPIQRAEASSSSSLLPPSIYA